MDSTSAKERLRDRRPEVVHALEAWEKQRGRKPSNSQMKNIIREVMNVSRSMSPSSSTRKRKRGGRRSTKRH